MTLILRSLLVVLCLAVLSCDPLDANAPLLSAHSAGVVSQATVDGGLFASSLLAQGPPDQGAPDQLAETAGDVAAAELAAPAADLAESEAPTLAGARASVRPMADSSSTRPASSEDLVASTSSLGSALDSSSQFGSGEYGGGVVVVQQAAAAVESGADVTAAADDEQALVVADDEGVTAAEETAATDLATDPSEPSDPVEAAKSTAVALDRPSVSAGSSRVSALDEFAPSVAVPQLVALDLNGVLPASPPSDATALAALAALPRRPSLAAAGFGQPCQPAASGLLRLSVGQLSMVRAWLDGTLLRAELRGPEGRLYTVVRGDRVGSDGGRVLQVSSTQVVVGEIGFGLDGNPFIVQEAIR